MLVHFVGGCVVLCAHTICIHVGDVRGFMANSRVCNPFLAGCQRRPFVDEGGRKGGPQVLDKCPFFWLARCVVKLSTMPDLFIRCARSLQVSPP
jgi:hypothetical protein